MNEFEKKQSQGDANPQSNTWTQGTGDTLIIASLILIALLVKVGMFNVSSTNISPPIVKTSQSVDNADVLVGKTVTIISKPIKPVGLSSFTVNNNSLFKKKSIMVVNASGVPFNLPPDSNTQVKVNGQVRKLVISKIEREFHLKLSHKYYTKYLNKPVIIAQSIKIVQRGENN